ncbi:hypothetical protein ILUMI_12050 [Ignelater luminosus]|uniref:ATP-dependent DNA helicase n=1 Tax=Ignelater luminosus TaxID=2038154 RepID=A0A8K0D0A6_IGNLU|nr:hypothetical protein ILUMI_12050 [Ignelater luminosus]
MPKKRKSRLAYRKGRAARGRVTSRAPTTVVESTITEIKSEPLPPTLASQAAEPCNIQRRSLKRPRLSVRAPKNARGSRKRLSPLQSSSSLPPLQHSSLLDNNVEYQAIQEAVQQERNQMGRENLPTFLTAATRVGVQTYHLSEMNRVCTFCKAKYFMSEVTTRKNYIKCCRGGSVQLPPIQPAPLSIRNLFVLDGERSRSFRSNILRYNSAFQFVVPKTNSQVISDGDSLVYIIQGKVHYYIPNVNLTNNRDSGSIYFLNSKQALKQRLRNDDQKILNKNVLRLIDNVLRSVNPFADGYKHLRTAYEYEIEQAPQIDRSRRQLVLEFINSRDKPLQHSMVNEVAAIYCSVDSCLPAEPNLRIFFQHQDDLQPVSHENPNVDALTFPLLFPHGDPGLNLKKLYNDNKVNFCQYYMYRLAYRDDYQVFYRGGLVVQQYILHAYIKIEANRLKPIFANQDRIHAEEHMGLADYLHHPYHHPMIILPSSFVGSARSQQQLFQDALAIVSKYDNPSLFITFSCNPKWPAITKSIPEGDNPFDHPMLIARIFQLMLHAFIEDIVTACVFGVPVVQLFVIEFQKNGWPYARIFNVFRKEDKLLDSYRVDQLISAEIPDLTEEPELYELVAAHMIHGPCGVHNLNSWCMEEGQCSKNYPKPLITDTTIQDNGGVIYRRRINDREVVVRRNNNEIKLNNSWVVPYNPYSLLKYRCYVNVEACASAETVRYLINYFFKTPSSDQSLVQIREEDGTITYSEVEAYLNRRFISPLAASWRINQFPMRESTHTVIRLPVHLPKQHTVQLRKNQEVERYELSQLTDWFRLNCEEPEACALLYEEVPLHYVWNNTLWIKRIRGGKRIIVRMFTVCVHSEELYYLRLLLLHVRGATSFNDLRTVDGYLCSNFQEACRRRNLLADESEWHQCIAESVKRRMTSKTRQLFAYILIFCKVSNALALWTEFNADLVEDFTSNGLDEDTAEQKALGEVQEILRIHERESEEFQLPLIGNPVDSSPNRFNVTAERSLGESLCAQLNADQRGIYETVMAAVRDKNSPERLFYLDGPSGSGKTFLCNTIITSLLGDEIIVLSVACTDLAAFILKGSKTVHSQFELPIPVVDDSTSTLEPDTTEGRLVVDAKVIIWDEVNMATRFEFEKVNSLLRSLCQNHLPFGGKIVLLGGDFRQCLPNVHNGHRLAVVDACIKNSHLWLNFIPLRLYTNVRLDADQQAFSRWLLQLGNDTLPHVWIGSRDYVELPSERLVPDIDALIRALFGDVNQNDVCNKAILTPLNESCHIINDRIVGNLPGEARIYCSADSVEDENDYVQVANYPVEFLNSLTPLGMPQHRLTLKVGALITLLRSLNVHRNLCNGTRLMVRHLGTNYIDAERVDASGCLTGERVFIPRIDLSTIGNTLPFKLRRRQFPVRLAYAITINSAQSRTLDAVGIYLPNTVISHGQLYTAFSRVRRLDSVFVCIENTPQQGRLKNDESTFTKNIVYTEIL